MHCHLITIEVGVERRKNDGMNLDGLTLNEYRLECLNAETVERRSAVEQNRMVLDDFFKDVPHDGVLPFNHFFCGLHRRAMATLLETVVDERLEQLERHLLRQTALMQVQLRTNDDDRTSGVIHALSKQILTEAALLAFQRVGQRLQRTVICAAQNTSAAAVVEQRVYGFLQHAFFIPN